MLWGLQWGDLPRPLSLPHLSTDGIPIFNEHLILTNSILGDEMDLYLMTP